MRIVAKVPFDSHTDPIFRDLKVLKFSDFVLFHSGKFMFFLSKGLLWNSFNDMFILANHIHPYNTRNSSNCNFYIPLVRTNIRKFSICFQGLKFFNFKVIWIYHSVFQKPQKISSLSLVASNSPSYLCFHIFVDNCVYVHSFIFLIKYCITSQSYFKHNFLV